MNVICLTYFACLLWYEEKKVLVEKDILVEGIDFSYFNKKSNVKLFLDSYGYSVIRKEIAPYLLRSKVLVGVLYSFLRIIFTLYTL